MELTQWKSLLYREGVCGCCFKCHRETMKYDSYAEYCEALPVTGYISFAFPNLQFGAVMYCGDCAKKVTAKEVYDDAKYDSLREVYYAQKSKFINKVRS